MEDAAGIALAVIVIMFIVFLIGRELMTWYWKINRIIELLQQQNTLLISIVNQKKSEKYSTLGVPEIEDDLKELVKKDGNFKSEEDETILKLCDKLESLNKEYGVILDSDNSRISKIRREQISNLQKKLLIQLIKKFNVEKDRQQTSPENLKKYLQYLNSIQPQTTLIAGEIHKIEEILDEQ